MYNVPKVCTTGRLRLLVVHTVYKLQTAGPLYAGKRYCCTLFCFVLRRGPAAPFQNIVSSRLQHVHSVYKCARCVPPMRSAYRLNHVHFLHVHSVYKLCTVSTCMRGVCRLYLGKLTSGNLFFKDAPSCTILNIVSLRQQHVQSVYNMCALYTAYTQPPIHSVHKLFSGKRVCAWCLQTIHSVYRYAQCLQTKLR